EQAFHDVEPSCFRLGSALLGRCHLGAPGRPLAERWLLRSCARTLVDRRRRRGRGRDLDVRRARGRLESSVRRRDRCTDAAREGEREERNGRAWVHARLTRPAPESPPWFSYSAKNRAQHREKELPHRKDSEAASRTGRAIYYARGGSRCTCRPGRFAAVS